MAHYGNGFINQTKEFIDGYVIGFCSIAGPDSSVDEDEADFWCSDGPSSAGWMIGYTIRSGMDFHRDPALTSMATTKGYWTASDATVTPDFKKYHLFLYGVNPSWTQTNDENRRIAKLGNDGITLCLNFSPQTNDSYICHPITHIPSTPNSTIDAGYFVVPSYLNETNGYVYAKTKYQGVLVGPGYGLNGTIWRMDMDLMYEEIITVRACVEDYHFKQGTPVFDDCYRAIS